MKTRRITILTCLMLSVLCMSIFTGTAEATVVWSDNFDDGNYDGWTILGYNETTALPIAGNYSAASGALVALDDDYNIARYDSTTNVGTWSFDMYVPDDDDNVGVIDVIFMSNGSRPITNYSSMFVSVEAYITMDRFDIWEMRGADGVLFYQFRPVTGIEGWHHFVVTRTSGGHFYIYHNGTKVTDFVSNDVASSAYFEFSSLNAIGAAIDNIVVNDTVWTPTTTEPTTTPTTGTPDILYLLITVGVGVAVIIVLALVFLRRK